MVEKQAHTAAHLTQSHPLDGSQLRLHEGGNKKRRRKALCSQRLRRRRQRRRARDSNPQPLTGYLSSNEAAHQFAYPPRLRVRFLWRSWRAEAARVVPVFS